MTFEQVARFYGAFLGRPYCRVRVVPQTSDDSSVCLWTPAYAEPNTNGYIDDYPTDIWEKHIREAHSELLEAPP